MKVVPHPEEARRRSFLLRMRKKRLTDLGAVVSDGTGFETKSVCIGLEVFRGTAEDLHLLQRIEPFGRLVINTGFDSAKQRLVLRDAIGPLKIVGL